MKPARELLNSGRVSEAKYEAPVSCLSVEQRSEKLAFQIRASFVPVFLTECCPVVWTYRRSLLWHKLSARWQ